MNLHKAILYVILGIIYTIVLKTGVSLLPRLTEPMWMAQTTQVLSLLASLSFIIFGVYFIKESIGQKNDRLKTALYLAFLSPIYMILIRIENIIRISPKLSLYLNDFNFWQKFDCVLLAQFRGSWCYDYRSRNRPRPFQSFIQMIAF